MNPPSIPEIDLTQVKMDPAWALRLAPQLALRRLVLPLCLVDDALVTAFADPEDAPTREMVERACGKKVSPVKVDAGQLRKELLRVYGNPRATQTHRDAATGMDDPVAVVESILRAATIRQASDIHLDPQRDGIHVRFRVDGVLETFVRLPLTIQAAVNSRVKVLAGLDIAERRAPQDGGFSWRLAGGEHHAPTDIRVATLPVRFGEKITLRLLDAGRERLTIRNLELEPDMLRQFEQILDRPHGLVLLTGPTGSGKTTTLYAAIRSLMERADLNILTVEDPIEYEIAGVSQVEVDSSDKVNFSKALRSLLRHDPDIVMIGEIRDNESLGTAVKAALTGHLVLSTLHTGDAIGSVARLLDMGLAPHLIAATLRLSAAQRLLRRLCPHCARPVTLSAAHALALEQPELEGREAWAPGGCLRCAGRGYSGRIGVFEFMVPDAEVVSMIAAGTPTAELAAYLRQHKMPTLLNDAAKKLLAGKITMKEIIQTLCGSASS